jgi:hypothetical protein
MVVIEFFILAFIFSEHCIPFHFILVPKIIHNSPSKQSEKPDFISFGFSTPKSIKTNHISSS